MFTLVEGMKQQRIVCRAIGCADDEKLWWFLDGTPAGESEAGRPFAIEMSAGEHSVTCTTAGGIAASVGFTVR